MSTITESFRLADVRGTGVTARGNWQDSSVTQATELAIPAIDWVLDLPGREQLTRLALAFKRPTDATQTAAQQHAEERLNTITHGLGLAVSTVAVVYLLVVVATIGDSVRVASCAVYGAS